MTASAGRRSGGGASGRGPARPPPGAAVLEAPREDWMRGPKVMAVALVAFFGSSVLAVHLMSLPGAPAPAMPAPRAARATEPPRPSAPAPRPVQAPAVAAAPPATTPADAEPLPDAGGEDFPFPVAPNLGVAPVPPAARPALTAEEERKLTACVERRLEALGGEKKLEPTLPGRWPALKRAREQQRLRRLELREECLKSLAG